MAQWTDVQCAVGSESGLDESCVLTSAVCVTLGVPVRASSRGSAEVEPSHCSVFNCRALFPGAA